MTSVFDFPNAVGLFLAPIVAASTVVALRVKRRQWLWGSAAVLGLVAIFLAQTEAALVAIPAALFVTLLISRAKPSTKKHAAFTGVLLLAVLFALPFTHSKLLLQDYSGQVRLAQWSETVQLLKDTPAFGAGLSGYPVAIEPYHDPTLYEIFQYPHNILLNTWVELGILGVVALFWLAWLTVRHIKTKGGKTTLKIRELAAFAALLTMTIHGLVDVPYFKNDLAVMTWIFIGMLALTPYFKNR